MMDLKSEKIKTKENHLSLHDILSLTQAQYDVSPPVSQLFLTAAIPANLIPTQATAEFGPAQHQVVLGLFSA